MHLHILRTTLCTVCFLYVQQYSKNNTMHVALHTSTNKTDFKLLQTNIMV